jgi:N-acetyltransferase 10
MLNVLPNRENKWLEEFAKDFHKRFLQLLSYEFRKFSAVQALNIIEAVELGEGSEKTVKKLTKSELDDMMSPFDFKRLESYANNLLDYHVIVDLLPLISQLYFNKKTGNDVNLSSVQAAILLAIGLQRKDMDQISKELNLPSNQSMAMFAKIIRKFSSYFRGSISKAIEESMPELEDEAVKEMDGTSEHVDYEAIEKQMQEDLDEAGDEAMKELRDKQRQLINAINLDKYTIADDGEWDDAEIDVKKAIQGKGVVSIKNKNSKRKKESADDIFNQEMKTMKKLKKTKKSKK